MVDQDVGRLAAFQHAPGDGSDIGPASVGHARSQEGVGGAAPEPGCRHGDEVQGLAGLVGGGGGDGHLRAGGPGRVEGDDEAAGRGGRAGRRLGRGVGLLDVVPPLGHGGIPQLAVRAQVDGVRLHPVILRAGGETPKGRRSPLVVPRAQEGSGVPVTSASAAASSTTRSSRVSTATGS